MIRIVKILAFAVAAAVWPQWVSAQSREAEEARVYSAAFDFLFGQYPGESPGTIVLADSTSPDAGSVAYKGVIGWPHKTVVDKAAVLDFEERNNRYSHLLSESAFSYRIPIVMLSLPEFFRLDTAGRKMLRAPRPYTTTREPGNFMDALVAKYPSIWGLTIVSRVGLNKSRTQAVVLVAHTCGYCWQTETLVFRKPATEWVLQERIPMQGTDGIGPGETRYLGVGARFLGRVRKEQDSTRKAIADSIALDAAPRRIHGKITSGQTGRPIPFARVTVISAYAKSNPWSNGLSDSLGRFTFADPPIGSTMVVASCPGSLSGDNTKVLGAPGTYVFPGSNTELDIVAPNIGPCWKSQRSFPLEPGWFESVEARTAAAPVDREAEVMAAAIAYARMKNSGSRIAAIQSHTMTRCRFNQFCGSVHFDRLTHQHVVDSSTVADFRNKTSKSEALIPSFATSIGLPVVTRDEMHYLATSSIYADQRSDPREDSTRFWAGFRDLHGKSSSVISVSRVGFNRVENEAVVEVRVDSGQREWSAYAPMMLLRSSGHHWKVIDDNVGRGGSRSNSGDWQHGACIAVAPPAKLPGRAIDTLLGTFDLTLVYAGEGRSTSLRVRVGRNLPPRWTPAPTSRSGIIASLPRSYEAIGDDGKPDIAETENLSIGGIPRNIIHDPDLIRLDGYYQNLTIMRITSSGFYGSFVDGVYGDSGFGYFCAQRVTPGR